MHIFCIFYYDFRRILEENVQDSERISAAHFSYFKRTLFRPLIIINCHKKSHHCRVQTKNIQIVEIKLYGLRFHYDP